MTLAATVVEQFEEKLIDVETNEVYAPIRKGTKDKRKGVPKKVSATLYNCLLFYYSIKMVHKDENPQELTLSQKRLMNDAKSAITENPKVSNSDFWFDKCTELFSDMDTSK